LPEEWKEAIIVLILRGVIKQTRVIVQAYHFCQPHTKFYPISYCQG